MTAQQFTDTELFGEAYMDHFTFDRAQEISNYRPGRFGFSYIPLFPLGEASSSLQIDFIFLMQFYTHGKVGQKVQRVSKCSLNPYIHNPLLSTSPYTHLWSQSVPFVITDKQTLTHCNHPESIGYIRVHSCIVYSVGFDTCIMTYMYLAFYSIIQK